MGKYFGTDGFRGKAGVDLTADHAFRIGRFLGWYYRKLHPEGESARIVIGKDTRRSSYMYESALAAGITSSGSDAYPAHWVLCHDRKVLSSQTSTARSLLKDPYT